MISNLDKCHPDAYAILTSKIGHEEKRDLLAARKSDKRIFFKDGECIHTSEDHSKSDGFEYCNDRQYSKKIALKQHGDDKRNKRIERDRKKKIERDRLKAAQDKAISILVSSITKG